MTLRFFLGGAAGLLISAACLAEDASVSQVEQARQFGTTYRPAASPADATPSSVGPALVDPEDDSFGSQQILKRVEKIPIFNLFGDVSAFYTNNVALTRRNTFGDAFLAANLGISAARNLTPTLQADFTGKIGIFRYSKFTEFDLDTVDLGAGLAYRLPRLWDASIFAHYDFTVLFNGQTSREFFENHAIDAGIQKTFFINRAQSFVMGLSADFNFSDPSALQRDEWSAYLGYHLDLTRHLSADLFYRYAYEVYTGGDRRDDNQNLTLSLRYAVNQWISIIASTYFTVNRSNYEVYSYNALAAGLGLSANIRF